MIEIYICIGVLPSFESSKYSNNLVQRRVFIPSNIMIRSYDATVPAAGKKTFNILLKEMCISKS